MVIVVDRTCVTESTQQQTCHMLLHQSVDWTDRRTLDRLIDPASHTVQAVSIITNIGHHRFSDQTLGTVQLNRISLVCSFFY